MGLLIKKHRIPTECLSSTSIDSKGSDIQIEDSHKVILFKKILKTYEIGN